MRGFLCLSVLLLALRAEIVISAIFHVFIYRRGSDYCITSCEVPSRLVSTGAFASSALPCRGFALIRAGFNSPRFRECHIK